jgi:opacity protein-like surface antigen
MKRIFIIYIILIFITKAEAQRNANIGVFAGTSYYLGDINQERIFYSPGVAVGGIYRYNINKRYAIRVNGYFTYLSGNPDDFSDNIYDIASTSSFSRPVFDWSMQMEFNFLPYLPTVKKLDYTSYISGGIGCFTISDNPITIPFGVGVKLNVTDKLCAGAEWSFRKTFNDQIDYTGNPTGINSFIHNTDWYSFMGVFITYKFFRLMVDCPAYSD